MKIRSKLIISFLALILVPIMVTALSGLLIYKNIIVIPELQELMETQSAIDKVVAAAQKNITKLNRPDYFAKLIQPFYTPYFERVVIVDPGNIVKFDSSNEFNNFNMTSLSFSADSKMVYSKRLYNPEYENIIIGDIVMVSPITTTDILKRALIVPYFLGVLFVVSIIAMIAVLSKIISDSIFLPLSILTNASQRIGEGDLTMTIDYESDDEMGKVFYQFDRMRRKLQKSYDTQKQYETSRKELIASISHDLKTPLTSIRGYVEGLQDGLVTDEATQTKYLNIIHNKASKLDFLIDDLFAYSQLELDKFSINLEPTNISYLLDSYTSIKVVDVVKNNLKLVLDQPFHSEVLDIDNFRITQVLDNILENAIKFTKTYIKVYTEVTMSYYIICVEDDGSGIPLEDANLVFDSFYKCDKSRSSNIKGTGLGLAICKQLVDHHKGRIYIDSAYKNGCLFKIELPRRVQY